jgi:hypothetical protein
VRPAPERWLGPAAKSDWVEKVRLWPAIEEDDRAFEIELREGGTHRLVAEGSTLELRLGPAAVLR